MKITKRFKNEEVALRNHSKAIEKGIGSDTTT